MKKEMLIRVFAGATAAVVMTASVAFASSDANTRVKGQKQENKTAMQSATKEERLAQLKVKLDAKVAAGELTQEEADAICAKAEEGNFGEGIGKGGPKDDGMTQEERIAKMKEKLAEEVAAGKITQEQADAMIAKMESGECGLGMGKGAPENDGLTKEERLAKLKTDLDAKVAAGEITQEQADTIYAKAESGDFGRGAGKGTPKDGHGRMNKGDKTTSTDDTTQTASE